MPKKRFQILLSFFFFKDLFLKSDSSQLEEYSFTCLLVVPRRKTTSIGASTYLNKINLLFFIQIWISNVVFYLLSHFRTLFLNSDSGPLKELLLAQLLDEPRKKFIFWSACKQILNWLNLLFFTQVNIWNVSFSLICTPETRLSNLDFETNKRIFKLGCQETYIVSFTIIFHRKCSWNTLEYFPNTFAS